jgi:DNA polymerase I-like protein with 3'-5' exonuclease and polymerase domains
LIVADYSQIEYVLFAHYSGDPYMIKMFREGFDAHTAMASLVTGKKPDDLTPEERTRYGKVVNFAIGFGAGAGQVASQAKVSMREAEGILESHRRASPKFYAWKRHEIAKVKSRRPPHVRTMLGRIRRLPEIFAQDNRTRFKAERQAINTKIQGSAADIIKLAMVGVHREFVGTDVQMILTVHDEIVSIAPEAIAEDAAATIKKIMEDVVELRAPLRASVTGVRSMVRREVIWLTLIGIKRSSGTSLRRCLCSSRTRPRPGSHRCLVSGTPRRCHKSNDRRYRRPCTRPSRSRACRRTSVSGKTLTLAKSGASIC